MSVEIICRNVWKDTRVHVQTDMLCEDLPLQDLLWKRIQIKNTIYSLTKGLSDVVKYEDRHDTISRTRGCRNYCDLW